MLMYCAIHDAEPDDPEVEPDDDGRAVAISTPECWERSYKLLTAALALPIPMDFPTITLQIRESHVHLSFCEMNLERYDDAIASFERARAIEPDELLEGQAYCLLPTILAVKQEKYGELIEKLKGWTLLERMTWLLAESNGETVIETPALTFMRAGHLSGEDEFVVQVYEEIIKFLDVRNMAGMMRYLLATHYSYITGDLEKAKTILKKLSHGVSIDPTWKTPNLEIPSGARALLAAVLYEQFRTTPDPSLKTKCLEEMRQVQEERMSDTSMSEMREFPTAPMYAIMLRKMGNVIEFQQVLEDAFRYCIATLTDAEGWNDSSSLRLLARVLALVGGLEMEAQIAFSAQYSVLDPDVDHAGGGGFTTDDDDNWYEGMDSENEGEDGETRPEPTKNKPTAVQGAKISPDAESSDEGEPTSDQDESDDEAGPDDDKDETEDSDDENPVKTDAVWGDIDTRYLQCCGEHAEGETKVGFENGPLYLCIICPSQHLCQGCFEKIRMYNRDPGGWPYWKKYCGIDHRYIKGPVDGWKGIRGGVMKIGESEEKFSEWLQTLKEKWEAAWQAFWVRQEGVVDIFGSVSGRSFVPHVADQRALKLITDFDLVGPRRSTRSSPQSISGQGAAARHPQTVRCQPSPKLGREESRRNRAG